MKIDLNWKLDLNKPSHYIPVGIFILVVGSIIFNFIIIPAKDYFLPPQKKYIEITIRSDATIKTSTEEIGIKGTPSNPTTILVPSSSFKSPAEMEGKEHYQMKN
jgi:hypothetical protein